MNSQTADVADLPSNIYTFNHLPNRYLHKTWWQALKHGDELALLATYPRTELRVANIVLEAFKLKNCYHYAFSSSLEKLVLLSGTEIGKLADYLGLCLTSKSISQSILKSEKLAFQQELGEEYYQFASNTAQQFCQVLGIKESRKIRAGHLLAQNHIIGLQLLGKAFIDTERAVTKRLILKLGKSSGKYIQQASRSNQLSTSQADCFKLINAVSQHLAVESTASEPIGSAQPTPSVEEVQSSETIQ